MNEKVINTDLHIKELISLVDNNEFDWESKRNMVEILVNGEHTSKYLYSSQLITEK